MRKTIHTVAALLVSLAICHAWAGEADEVKKLQGTWEVVDLVAYGKKVDLKTIQGTKFVFAKDKLTIQAPKDKIEEFKPRNFSFKLNPTKQPSEIDLTVLDAEDKGLISTGIYELKGDTLRWCQSDATTKPERPKAFESAAKSPIYLFTLKKITK